MFPIMCIKPPCINIEEKIVINAGTAYKSLAWATISAIAPETCSVT